MNGAPLLRVELRASYALAAALMLVHAAAAASVAAVFPWPWGTVLAGLILALGAASAWDRALLRARRSVRSVELGAGGQAALGLRDGGRVEVTVGPRRNVRSWWVTLPLGSPASRTLLVLRDMLPEGEFRRLRIWALWGRLPGVAAAQLAA